jgi:hypothetical protein
VDLEASGNFPTSSFDIARVDLVGIADLVRRVVDAAAVEPGRTTALLEHFTGAAEILPRLPLPELPRLL